MLRELAYVAACEASEAVSEDERAYLTDLSDELAERAAGAEAAERWREADAIMREIFGGTT